MTKPPRFDHQSFPRSPSSESSAQTITPRLILFRHSWTMDISQSGGSNKRPAESQAIPQTGAESSVPPESTHVAARPFKRPRLKLACQICRDRKIRCDGARPVCDSCSRKKYSAAQCIYPSQEVEEAQR